MTSSESLQGVACAVTGATNPVGAQLLKQLISGGTIVHAIGRGSRPGDIPPSCEWHQCDLTAPGPLPRFFAEVLFHVASIWLLPERIEEFRENGVNRIIVFSSTSGITKANSSSPAERKVAATFARSEELVGTQCEKLGIAYTIFRPTMIYGGGRDRNVSDIARVVRKFGVFPILGKGVGLRQPVHIADLAEACILAAHSSASFNRTYNLSGGETLTYRQMVERIFNAMGKRTRIVSVPASMFGLAISVVRLSPKFKHLKLEMARRMDRDLYFDHDSAVQDFGYSPRSFLLDRETLGIE